MQHFGLFSGFCLARASVYLAFSFLSAAVFFHRRARMLLVLPPAAAWNDREMRRVRHYFFGATYLTAVFCLLRGRGLTASERRACLQLAALSSFFDDLADTVPGQSDAPWTNDPVAYGRLQDPRGLAVHFLENVRMSLPPVHAVSFERYLHRVFAVETRGRQRAEGTPGHDELDAITAEKGGCSVLLFRCVLAHPLSPREEAALYAFGHFIQLCDDIFDVWFDRRAGTVTVATTLLEAGRADALRAHFDDRAAALRRAFDSAPLPRQQRETAWHAVRFLVAITRVALDRFAVLQKKLGTLPLADRHAMVVDMERWSNRLRAARHLLWMFRSV